MPRSPRLFPILLLLAALLVTTHTAHAQRKLRRQQSAPQYKSDTCYFGHPGLPWEYDGLLRQYVTAKMANLSPSRMASWVNRTQRNATLHLRFDDPYLVYPGYCTTSDQASSPGSTSKPNWLGMDLLTEAIARDLILDVTTFDLSQFSNLDFVKCLSGPLAIRLVVALPMFRALGDTVAGGPIYAGEFKFLHPASDTLQIPLEVDGQDTLIFVPTGQPLTTCQLAALKGIGMQWIFRQQLDRYCGPAPADLYAIDPDKRGIFPIFWHPISISTYNRIDDAPFFVEIDLHFGRIIHVGELVGSAQD